MKKLPRNGYRLSIISSCNMKCSYCHNEGNTKCDILKMKDIQKLVEDSLEFGLTEMRLTGGEPLLHPQIYEICELLTKKYHLKIGINTNCIEIEKLLYLISMGWIDRVVVGIDYFDSKISKDSPVGASSQKILENILKIKQTGCNVSISSVYNNDLQNKLNMVKWAIQNKIRIKILEIVNNEKGESVSREFVELEDKVKKIFGLKYIKDEYNEISGFINDEKVITFFHSHCRLRECNICKLIHLRVTASGKMKQCMYTEIDDINIKDEDFKENLIKYLNSPAKYYY